MTYRIPDALIEEENSKLVAAHEDEYGALQRQLARRGVNVEAIVAKSVAVAMSPRDALALEQSRGYADIEPELAWPQWQIVRRTLASLLRMP